MTDKGELLTHKGEEFMATGQISVSFLCDLQKENSEVLLSSATNTSCFQMIFILKGTVNYCNAATKNASISIGTQQHNLILIPANTILKLDDGCEQHDIISISISPSFLSRYIPQEHPAFKHLFAGNKTTNTIAFSKRNFHITPEISSILNSIANSTHQGFCKKLFLESKVLELLSLQMSQFELSESESLAAQLKKDDLDKMNEAREILIGHNDTQLSLRTLAHMVGTNEFNLKKNFKIAFGNTVYGYLNQHKMEQAKTLLIEGDAKISEVSSKMGYKHATHFTSAFKKYFGYLPTKIKMIWLMFDPEFYLILFSV